jgi:hypothetical protein
MWEQSSWRFRRTLLDYDRAVHDHNPVGGGKQSFAAKLGGSGLIIEGDRDMMCRHGAIVAKIMPGLEDRCTPFSCGLQDAPSDAVRQGHRVEIDQQSDAARADAKVGQQLGFVQRVNLLHRFEFEDNVLLDNDVCLVTGIEIDTVVNQGEPDMLGERQVGFLEFVAEASLVGGFQEARAQARVDAHGKSDDLVCEIGGGARFLGHDRSSEAG